MMLEHLGEKPAADAADAGGRARHGRPGAAHARPRRQGDHGAGHRRRVRGAARRQRLSARASDDLDGSSGSEPDNRRAAAGSPDDGTLLLLGHVRRRGRRRRCPRCCVPRIPAGAAARAAPIVIGAGKASAAMARAVEEHWPRPARRARRHPLRPRRPLRAHRDRRGRASGARRARRARRRAHPRDGRAAWRRTTSCSA